MATAPDSTQINRKFLEGSTMRHVINMTATGSVGLIAVFLVDVLNLIYVSQLGKHEITAAIGYASTLLFFHTSIGIGLSIATTAVVSRAVGAGEMQIAKQLAGSALYLIAGISTLLVLLTYPLLSTFLSSLGAVRPRRFWHYFVQKLALLNC